MRYAVLLLLAGCASVPSDRAVMVYEVEMQEIEGCGLLGQVTGRSGFAGAAGQSTGQNNARVAAKEKAAKLGANRIVWISGGGTLTTTATGRAYRCGS